MTLLSPLDEVKVTKPEMHMDTVDYFFQYKHKDNNLCPQLIPYSYAWMLYVGLALI